MVFFYALINESSAGEGYWSQGSWMDAPHNGYTPVTVGPTSRSAVASFTIAKPWNNEYH